MMKFVFLLAFVTVAQSLSSEEIDDITSKIDSELKRLRDDATKKSTENDVATSIISDAKVDRLLHHFKKDKKTAKLKDEKTRTDDALLNLIIQDEEKKKEAKIREQTKKESDEAFLRLLIEDERKKAAKKKELKSDLSKKSADADNNAAKRLLDNFAAEDQVGVTVTSETEFEYRDFCEDTDGADNCQRLIHFCKTHKESLTGRCDKTCGYCKQCKDIDTERCEVARKGGYCENYKLKANVSKQCPKSCGVCGKKAPSPPACQNDPEGCCWDGFTFAKDGCLPCENSRVIGRICETFLSDCDTEGVPGKFMKENCPESCGLCGPKECKNHPDYDEKYCQIKGICDKIDFRLIYCRKTCGHC